MQRSIAHAPRVRLAAMAVVHLLLMGAAPGWAAEAARAAPLGHADLVKQATQQSAAAHRVERLPDGHARIPSPMQGIEAEVAPEGVAIRSTVKEEPGRFALRAEAIGHGGEAQPVTAGEVTVDGETVHLIHPNLIEELTTNADGVRQDFIVPVRPAGQGTLELTLKVEGATVATRGDAVVLTLASGRELLYHELHVTDGANRALKGRFAIADAEHLRIDVEERGAIYPIRIDPTITDADWLGIATPSINGSVNAMVWDGANLYIGGDFTVVPGTRASGVAKWNGSSWSALGTGVSGIGASAYVTSLAWDGTNLYVGGQFTSVGGVACSNVAKWNAGAWSALGSGVNSRVIAMVSGGGALYATGWFTTAGGTSAGYIAKWNGSAWAALGTGLNDFGSALAWDGSNLYAGGSFWAAGGGAAARVAKWNGSAWSALGSGLTYAATSLVWAGSTLYAGGSGDWYYNAATGTYTVLPGLKKWTGASWSDVGVYPGLSASKLAWAGGSLFALDGALYKWDGASWTTVSNVGQPSSISTITSDGTNLYVGAYWNSGDAYGNLVAKWNGSTWSSLDATGTNGYASALAVDGTNLYVGGNFTVINGTSANRIAKWNGTAWTAMGSGMNGGVNTLLWNGGRLYAGGGFATAGGASANGIAQWDGTTWSPLGSGMVGSVSSLAWAGGNLYAGGSFTSAGGIAANSVAKWDGATWSGLGTGVNGQVMALAHDGTRLYAGGVFTTAGGTPAPYIAQWDGNSWSPLGTGMNSYGYVGALATDGTTLYAGGAFTTAGGTPAKYVAKWDGSNWSALGSGMNSSVSALAFDGGSLYAGGYFTTAGGVSCNYIAKWNGESWSSLGSGADYAVTALAFDGSNHLYAGGRFANMAGVAARVAKVTLPLGVERVRVPASGTYGHASPIDIETAFSRPVTVSGQPRLPLTVGGVTRYAAYNTGSGTATLTFRYTPAATDLDSDGIAVTGQVESNGATIRDHNAYDAALTFAVPNTSGILVVGNNAPVVSGGALGNVVGGHAVNGILPGSDQDNDVLTFAIKTSAAHGNLTLTDASTGAFTYTADSGYTGSDGFTYTVSDGMDTVEGTVTTQIYPAVTLGDGNGGALPGTPTVTSGSDYTVHLSGGSGDYAASIQWPDGSSHGLALTGDGFTFSAPTTGAFAGDYVVTVTDATSGQTEQVSFTVPLVVTADRAALLSHDGQRRDAEVQVHGGAVGSDLAVTLDAAALDAGLTVKPSIDGKATDDEPHGNPAKFLLAVPDGLAASLTATLSATGTGASGTRTIEAIAAVAHAGTVVNGAGAPVAGATVSLLSQTGADAPVTWMDDVGAIEAATAMDGTFILYAPPAGSDERLSLHVMAEHYDAQTEAADNCIEAVPCTIPLAFASAANAPTFTPNAGTYEGSVTVTLESGTVGATLRYTTDGTDPGRTEGTEVANGTGVVLNNSQTLKAVAYDPVLGVSNVASGVYTVVAATSVSGLKATVVGANEIDLTWMDNSKVESGYRIFRAQGTGSFVLVAQTAANATGFKDMRLTARTAYRYFVTAFTAKGASANSATVSATTATDTTKPTIRAVTPASGATGVKRNAEVSVTFSEALGCATVTATSFSLKNGTTAVPAVLKCSGATATLAPKTALLATKKYTAQVTTAIKDKAGNPLAAGKSWSFTTGSTTDAVKPTLAATNPVPGATNVGLGVVITGTFSEALDCATVTAATAYVTQNGVKVAGLINCSGKMVSFDPTALLGPNTPYTVTLTSTITDLTGNASGKNYVMSFTTKP